jgi:hypothetical protein
MMRHNLILELAAWGFDESPERPLALLNGAQARAEEVLARRQASEARPAIAHDIPDGLQEMLGRIAEREDIQAEFHGFEWEIGVVDLRMLVSFQRRLALRDDFFKNNDIVPWPSRIHIAFPRRRNSQVAHMLSHNALTLSSENPDFSVRLRAEANEASEFGLTIHHGSPFMEVGVYRGRWFLRDGYHRAYSLLQAGVFEIPAVIVHARTLEELGANQPWFFPEQVLFGARPPLVADFQCDDLVLRWRRPARRKVVRITITEEFEPSCPEEEGRTEYEYCNQAR